MIKVMKGEWCSVSFCCLYLVQMDIQDNINVQSESHYLLRKLVEKN